jgi:valyl-tRNA synthetase
VEVSKVQIAQGQKDATAAVLRHVLEASLRLLHPVMPFVTEELWQHVHQQDSIMKAPWPKPTKALMNREVEARFAQLQAVVSAIRNTRSELNVPLASRPPVRLRAKEPAVLKFFEAHQPLLQALTHAGDITVDTRGQRPKHAAATIVDGIEVIVPLEGLIDIQQERGRLQQRVTELTNELSRLELRLRDQQFVQKAPKEVIEQAKSRRTELQDTLKKFSEHLAVLQSM